MGIAALKTITDAAFPDPSKDPPWRPQDLSKLRILMDQGATVADMARELGTTITDVRQKVAALTDATPDANPVDSSSGPETTSPLTGNNVNIKV